MQLKNDINLEAIHQFLTNDEFIKNIEKPGEGNMNIVLRIVTNKRTFIAKQSKPYVQKYKDIPAPIERIAVEHLFYKTIHKTNKNQHFPTLIDFIKDKHLLFLEDLGQSKDFTFLYQTKYLDNQHLKQLITIANNIHQTPAPSNYPTNFELRKLNHQHIFVLPFLENNQFSLDAIQEGLQKISLSFKRDLKLKEKALELGQKYLASGNTLLHGDFYPGSWILNEKQVYVIDPEFSYLGCAEFDIGVMAAHIVMATGNPKLIETIFTIYKTPINKTLVKEFAGVEIIRRLIGLAQLPIQRTLKEKQELLNMAKSWLINC